MSELRRVAVIDIGKTTAKLALVDMEHLSEIAVRRTANRVLPGPPYPHFDIDALWRFILEGLTAFHADHGIDAITVTTHGASAALLDADGVLAAPVLDYEHDGPDTLAARYEAARPDFAETGSPRLPLGLNLGAQLFWQFRTFPEIAARTRLIVTYPQYWVARLTGTAVNEVTSLGCHTDLWNPHQRCWSSLCDSEGWTERMAPIARADDRIGTILPRVATATGLGPTTPVYCGIHDSNASLYAHLVARDAPFAVVSTGTWVITMAIGGQSIALDPTRDTLINVNALGDPVPSARFMGGREFERIMGNRPHVYGASDLASVLTNGIMLLPSVEALSGPIAGRAQRWTIEESRMSDAERFVAVSCYLANMTAIGLELTGAKGPTIVEGPLAGNPVYLGMLGAATARPVDPVPGTGTSIGASLLVMNRRPRSKGGSPQAEEGSAAMHDYWQDWKSAVS
jgi:sugar (pentulose or hexulose) kinase